MLHGKKAAQSSEKAAIEIFSGKSLSSNMPSMKIQTKDFDNKISILDLVIFSKLENSKSEVRRLIRGNAVKIDNQIITDEKFIIDKHFSSKNYFKLSIGKKRHLKIELD